MATSLRLDGRIAVVTGSSRGIGRAIAETLAEHGAGIVLNGRHDDGALSALADDLARRHDVPTLAFAADVTDPAAVTALYRAVQTRFRRLDILVNNAGILGDGLIGMIGEDMIGRTLDVNVAGSIRHLQLAARLIGRGGTGGAIVTLGSIIGSRGNAGQTVYAATKAALVGMTLAAAKELAPKGIRVNAVAPGLIDTDMIRHLEPETLQTRRRSIGLGRIGTPEDVAGAVLFLVSDLAAYVTGQVIGVDGGMVI